VLARQGIYDAMMQGPASTIDFFHGYTYSGHPLACAAAIATLDIYATEGLFEQARSLSQYWEDAVHQLGDLPSVIDVRNLGLVAGIELAPLPGQPGKRAYDVFVACFEAGLLIRVTGDIIALSPPLIITKPQIDQLIDRLSQVLQQV
jgi:beta-alanine--pyruvate transaminase